MAGAKVSHSQNLLYILHFFFDLFSKFGRRGLSLQCMGTILGFFDRIEFRDIICNITFVISLSCFLRVEL
jgi:hypothetical protein